MTSSGSETEAKFHVRDLRRIENRLLELGARLDQPRIHEINLRFDTPANGLRAEKKVLRLRRDDKARLTFKSPRADRERGIPSRREIEFVVEDFDKAREFLEALGYRVVVFYEKFRATYRLNETLVMLDELPYGTFVEIEGEDADEIHRIAGLLGLRWEAMVKAGYHALYDRTARKYGLNSAELSFEELKKARVNTADMGIFAADE